MGRVKQNRFSGEFIEYGILEALLGDFPESNVTLLAGSNQSAFDAARDYIVKLHARCKKAESLGRKEYRPSKERLDSIARTVRETTGSGDADLRKRVIGAVDQLWRDRESLGTINGLLKRRNDAVVKLMKSLEYLPRERQYSVITSWMGLDQLEELTEFQRRPEEKQCISQKDGRCEFSAEKLSNYCAKHQAKSKRAPRSG